MTAEMKFSQHIISSTIPHIPPVPPARAAERTSGLPTPAGRNESGLPRGLPTPTGQSHTYGRSSADVLR